MQKMEPACPFHQQLLVDKTTYITNHFMIADIQLLISNSLYMMNNGDACILNMLKAQTLAMLGFFYC